MRSYLLLTGALPLAVGIRIIQTSHDGWAEANVRTFFDVLSNAGHQVLLSGPANAYPFAAYADIPPWEVGSQGCIHSSCPPGSPPTGADDIDPRLNYVNSYPVTAIKHGIHVTGPELWNGAKPEIALIGPNLDPILRMDVHRSGSMGAASHAVRIAKIPAIVFSGVSGRPTAWNSPVPLHSKIYADLAMNITASIVHSGEPYLPPNTILNVRFPLLQEHRCNDASEITYIFTRMSPAMHADGDDVEWCGRRRLPWDTHIMIWGRFGCYATISLGDARNLESVNDVATQQQIIDKLGPILSCLPETE